MLNNGNGTFQAKTDYLIGSYTSAIQVGDINRDGVPDLVTANLSASSPISIFLGNGNGTFQPRLDYFVNNANTSSASVQIGDLNRDGKPDLAVIAGNGVSVLLAN